jgi:hypothetical protein
MKKKTPYAGIGWLVFGAVALFDSTQSLMGNPIWAWERRLPHSVTTLLAFVGVMMLVAAIPALLMRPIKRDRDA